MGKSKVLLIEDEANDFFVTKKWLESLGYSVLPADFQEMSRVLYSKDSIPSIEEFIISQIKDNYEDLKLILCDMQIGFDDQAGLKIVKSIREHKGINSLYGLTVPIFAISRLDDDNLKNEMLAAGADYVVERCALTSHTTELLFKKQSEGFTFSENIEVIDNKNKEHIKKRAKVFIVHGHSELNLHKTKLAILSLGFEPVILRDLPNAGQTLIQKFENYSNVEYAIVIYTACDYGCTKEDKDNNDGLKPRARQNVVFEHGYLNAKLGRNKVCALVEEGIETPSVLSGLSYVRIDEYDKWQYGIAREMKDAGLNVDLNRLL